MIYSFFCMARNRQPPIAGGQAHDLLRRGHGCRHKWSGSPAAPPAAEPSGCANDGRCRALTLGEAHTAEPAPRPARRSSVGLCERRALPRPHAGGSACCGASPAPAGRRAFSADVHVRADAAGWSSWVAERSPTDATLWLLTHHACTPGASRHCDGARRML